MEPTTASDWVQRIRDEEQLAMLKLCFRVEACFQLLLGCCCFGVMVLGMLLLGLGAGLLEASPLLNYGAWAMVVGGGLLGLGAWLQGFLDLAAARAIGACRARRFCFCVALSEALFFPFGTLLAVCTFVVLTKPSVRRLFGENS